MADMDFAPLKLFITGPTMIRDEVRQAASLPEYGHRDLENEKRFGPVFENLRAIAGAGPEYEIFLINGSGSTCLEASIRSLVSDDETVLNVSVGAFGDLYHNIALSNGKKAEQLLFPGGKAADPAAVEEALKKYRPGVLTLTHNETSTGVVNDIKALCELARKYGAMPLVDGVSIFGGMDIGLEDAKPAIYCTATQKSLALPAGFGIGIVHRDALAKAEKVRNRGYSSDILKQMEKARKRQALTTPNTALGNQMRVQLDYIVEQEGLEARYARHALMRDMTHEFIESLDGYRLFAQEGFRSPTLTTVQAPQGVTAEMLKKKLKEQMRGRGYLFDPGYGKLNTILEEQGEPPVFRIGHMGDIMPAMLSEYLQVLKEELALL